MSRPTKGWKKAAPRKTSVRRKMPRSCFLKPGKRGERPKYPVCPKGSKKPTCRGTLAAYKRARQQHDQGVARKAVKKGKSLGCTWAAKH